MKELVLLVLSYSFQVEEAVILGSYFWNKSKSITSTIISNHIAITSDLSGKITIFKDELQKTAEEYYRNIAAIINIILGYGIAIFTHGCEYSDCTVLLLVIIIVIAIFFIERTIVRKIAKNQFNSDIKIDEKDYYIPKGFVVFRYDATQSLDEDKALH